MVKSKYKLIVFFGKPGVGKSTLIKHLFSGAQVIDVMPFVKKYKKKEKVPEAQTIHAYNDMYAKISEMEHKGDLILELGTNHPELNIKKLSKLKEKFYLKTFLCDAPKHVCRERALKRERDFDKKALELRLERDFPSSHIKLLEREKINYRILNMETPLKDIIKEIKTKL